MKPLNGELKKAETILKGHRIDLKRRSEVAKQVRLIKSRRKSVKNKNAIVSLNTIFRKSKKANLDLKRTRAQEKKAVSFASDKYELLFVVRNSRSVESAVCKEALRDLGLSRFNTGRFLSNSSSNLAFLEKVLPFVYYGPVSLKIVKELLHKRGTIYESSSLTPISGNLLVERHFSSFGLYSLPELIDCIVSGSEHSEDVLLKLGPVNLSSLDVYSRLVLPSHSLRHFDHSLRHGRTDLNSLLTNR